MQIAKVSTKGRLGLLCRKYCSYLLLLIPIYSSALIKENLYSIDISIESKNNISVEKRKKFIEQAFTQVLQKITAKPTTLDPKLFDQYLSRYFYNQNTDGDTVLTIIFDAKTINQDLLNNNYKFLGEHRPLTIIWPKALDIDNNQELLPKIVATAKINGLTVIYPMLDMVDLKLLNQPTENEQEFFKLLKQGSRRYSADEIILLDSSNTELLSWQSITSNWQVGTNDAAELIEHLMQHFIDKYMVNNNIDKKAQELIVLKITNVINLEDYVRVENYLQNLSFVKNLQATNFSSGEVAFEISLYGNTDAIIAALNNSSMLKKITPNNFNFTNSNINNKNILYYSL